MWWPAVLAVVGGLLLLWLALLVVLAVRRPRGQSLTDTLRLLPDLVRLCARLARDPQLPRSLRWELVALAGYLASPVDVVPDVIPVVGYADDAVLVALVLRHVVRRAGPDALTRHWPGTPEGLASLRRLLRLSPS